MSVIFSFISLSFCMTACVFSSRVGPVWVRAEAQYAGMWSWVTDFLFCPLSLVFGYPPYFGWGQMTGSDSSSPENETECQHCWGRIQASRAWNEEGNVCISDEPILCSSQFLLVLSSWGFKGLWQNSCLGKTDWINCGTAGTTQLFCGIPLA